MTHAQAVLLVTPVSLTLITGALLMLVWQVMPQKPQPVYLANGTVDRLAQAIRANAQEQQIGLVDADGYLVIRGERFMMRYEGYEESRIFIRQKVGTS